MPTITESSSDDEEWSGGGPKMRTHRTRKKRKSSKVAQGKQQRKAKARKEAAQKRKERKLQQTNAKKRAAAAAAPGSTSYNADDPIKGYCDICQMSEKYNKNHMKLWRCGDCGVHVHDICYGASEDLRNKPNPNFRCWACQAKGQTVKVRDRDQFSGECIEVKQKERPKECCLCDVDDGIHAMHPIYDAHGIRGRQIYLAKDDFENKPRRLAWAHTLCCLTICQSNECKGAVYGCGPDGFDGDESDCDLLSDSDSVNSDLVDQGRDLAEIHHFVWWGHLHRFKGLPEDDWSKTLTGVKTRLRCNICGKNDKPKMKLTGGQRVFQSLRVPLQCCAHNEDEADLFKKYHQEDQQEGPCCVAIHPGCALWGRNDDGEYRRPRSSWFFPGLDGGKRSAPLAEVYCRRHAEDLFCLPALGGSDMSDKLPGPFEPISGPAQERYLEMKAKKARSGGGDDDQSHATASTGGSSPAFSGAARSPPAARGGGYQSRQKKRGSDSKKAQAKSPGTPIMRNVSLHGETRKKRVMELKKAGEAVMIQTKKQGRLVSKPKNSSTYSSSTHQQQVHRAKLDMIQGILDELVKLRNECEASGKTFGTPQRVTVRVQSLKKFNGTKEEFDEVWKSATEAFNDGILDIKAHMKSSDDDVVGEDAVMHDDNGDEEMEGDNGTNNVVTQKGQSAGESEPGKQAEEVGNGTSDAASLQKKSVSFVDDPQSELIETIVNDILAALKAEGQTDRENGNKEVIKSTLKERKSHWKKKSGLSRADYKVLFGKAIVRLSEVTDWLQVTDKSSDNNTASTSDNNTASDNNDAQSKDQDIPQHQADGAAVDDAPVNEDENQEEEEIPQQAGDDDDDDVAMEDAPVMNEHENHEDEANESMNDEQPSDQVVTEPVVGKKRKRDSNQQNSMQEESNEANGRQSTEGSHSQQNDNVVGLDESRLLGAPQHQPAPIKPPSRWSFLHYGPHYRKEGFQFDKWDTYEEIENSAEEAAGPAQA